MEIIDGSRAHILEIQTGMRCYVAALLVVAGCVEEDAECMCVEYEIVSDVGFTQLSIAWSESTRMWTDDFVTADDVRGRLLGFQRHYQRMARPFEWRFTRADLVRLLRRCALPAAVPKAA